MVVVVVVVVVLAVVIVVSAAVVAVGAVGVTGREQVSGFPVAGTSATAGMARVTSVTSQRTSGSNTGRRITYLPYLGRKTAERYAEAAGRQGD